MASKLPLFLSSALVFLASSGAAAWAYSHYVPSPGTAEGLRIDGEPVPTGADLSAFVDEKATALLNHRVTLTIDGLPTFQEERSLGELGVRVDTERMIRLARAIGHEGGLADRVHDGLRARRGEVDLPLVLDVDADVLEERLAPIREATNRHPVRARYDFSNQAILAHEPGQYLDFEGSLSAIREAAMSKADAVDLPRRELEPRVSTDYVKSVDLGKSLAKFETRFSRTGDQSARRARNIEVASERLDGMVLMPKESVSFNEVVGARTVENGFQKAWEIFRGEMVEGVGGGTCQVSSTLYAAAYLAGMDVLERLPHSRPSAYITMGLDATVVYPVVDLKLRNPFDFPVVIRANVIGNTMRFELFGREKPAEVSFGRDVVSSRPFRRRVEETPGLKGKIIRKQHGIRGYTVKRVRRFLYEDGTERLETHVDHYPPTAEIYQIPPGLDIDSVLPPLPEDGEEGETVVASVRAKDAPRIIDLPVAQAPTREQSSATRRVVIRGD